jgi:hypothetical protein
MVSVTDPPAASAAVVRSVTETPRPGRLNDAGELAGSAARGDLRRGCQVFPPSKETATAALVIAGPGGRLNMPDVQPDLLAARRGGPSRG